MNFVSSLPPIQAQCCSAVEEEVLNAQVVCDCRRIWVGRGAFSCCIWKKKMFPKHCYECLQSQRYWQDMKVWEERWVTSIFILIKEAVFKMWCRLPALRVKSLLQTTEIQVCTETFKYSLPPTFKCSRNFCMGLCPLTLKKYGDKNKWALNATPWKQETQIKRQMLRKIWASIQICRGCGPPSI